MGSTRTFHGRKAHHHLHALRLRVPVNQRATAQDRLRDMRHPVTIKRAFLDGMIYRDGIEGDPGTDDLPWKCITAGEVIGPDGCAHVHLPGYPGPAPADARARGR